MAIEQRKNDGGYRAEYHKAKNMILVIFVYLVCKEEDSLVLESHPPIAPIVEATRVLTVLPIRLVVLESIGSLHPVSWLLVLKYASQCAPKHPLIE